MTKWLPSLDDPTVPSYLALADAIAEAARSGTLAPGDRLPPQRDLAFALGLSLSTITRAYAEAARRGLVEATVGRGTFIRGPATETTVPWHPTLARPVDGPIDFANNLPFAGKAAARLALSLADLASETALGTFLDHAPDAVMRWHAEVAARWIEGMGLLPEGRSVSVVSGAQQGLFVSFLALAHPGDAVLVEELTYPPVLAIARHLGLTLIPVAIDGEGLVPEALEARAAASGARILHTMPTLHTPTAATMGVERRRAIADICTRRGLTVIEDDVFAFLPRDRPPPLAHFAPDNTLFITSTSKSMAPGLRVGFIHAPGRLESALRSAIAVSSWMPPPLMAEIAARWIDDGTALLLNGEQRAEAEWRQALARDILAGSDMRSNASGFHIWLRLPEPLRGEAFEAAARETGVLVRSGATFAVDPRQATNAVRLCLSHEPDRARVRKGLERLASLLARPRDASAFVV
jgi:DNA-binding transcriptional MocR family regulator